MADERCPLCMEKLKNGECVSCGYKLPNDDNISSIYDYEPAEYPQPEPAIREITPEVQMEEIYPNRQETPKFKVRTDEGKTVRTDFGTDFGFDTAGTRNKPEAEKRSFTESNPRPNNGNPYSGYTPDGVPNKASGSPFANQSANQSADTNSTSAFWKKYWWLILLSFFIPIVGIILYSTMKNEIKQYKANYLIIIAIVLGFIL